MQALVGFLEEAAFLIFAVQVPGAARCDVSVDLKAKAGVYVALGRFSVARVLLLSLKNH